MENASTQDRIDMKDFSASVHEVAEELPTSLTTASELKIRRGPVLGGLAAFVLLGLAIVYGVHSRTKTEDQLKQLTLKDERKEEMKESYLDKFMNMVVNHLVRRHARNLLQLIRCHDLSSPN